MRVAELRKNNSHSLLEIERVLYAGPRRPVGVEHRGDVLDQRYSLGYHKEPFLGPPRFE